MQVQNEYFTFELDLNQPDLERKNGNLGTRSLVHFRAKFRKKTKIQKVNEMSESCLKI